MRKFTLGFILICLAASFASCTKTEYVTVAPEEEVDNSTYTIMMYGCGGSNLDSSMILNIQEALLAGASERVNFTGQIKFSKRYQVEETLAGTQRFIVGEPGAMWYEPVEVLPADLELHNPRNLTDFINWSKAQCPADEYILILWNHGGAWSPYDDYKDPSRGVIFDDNNNNECLGLDNLVQGIKDSNTKFKMVYYDACLMGMIEIVTGLNDCTDYTMCASHITPGLGGDYNSLIYHLNTSTNFEESMKAYCHETMSHWEPQGLVLDLMLVNNGKMQPLLDEIKVLSEYMAEVAEIYVDYQDDEHSDSIKEAVSAAYVMAITSCYQYHWGYYDDGTPHYPFFDLQSFVEIMANGNVSTYSAKFVDISSRINRASANAIVCRELTAPIAHLNLTMGITIVDKANWRAFGYSPAYEQLEFHKKTGWGNWLKINPVMTIGNPNPKSYVNIPDFGDSSGTTTPVEEEINYLLSLIGKNK